MTLDDSVCFHLLVQGLPNPSLFGITIVQVNNSEFILLIRNWKQNNDHVSIFSSLSSVQVERTDAYIMCVWFALHSQMVSSKNQGAADI